MMFVRKVLVVLDVYDDFRDDPTHLPQPRTGARAAGRYRRRTEERAGGLKA